MSWLVNDGCQEAPGNQETQEGQERPDDRDSGRQARDQREEVARLRCQIAAMSGRPDQAPPLAPVPASSEPVRASSEPARASSEPAAVLPLPEGLAELVPQQGIPRGNIIHCTGARSFVIAVIAAVTQAGGQVGLVGLPQIGLLAAAELGANLDRIAAVPTPGVDPVEVASVLLDGMDLVVMGMGGVRVPPGRMRVVAGRARSQSSSLLVVGGEWPGARLSFDAQVLAHRRHPMTAASGSGRIGGMQLRVSASARGRGQRSIDIELRTTGFGSSAQMELAHVQAEQHRPILAVAN